MSSSGRIFFGFILFGLAGGFFWFSQKSQNEILAVKPEQFHNFENFDDKVQYHLSEGSIRLRQKQVRVELQNQLAQMQVGNQLKLPQKSNPLVQKGVDHTFDRHETSLHEDLQLNRQPVVLTKPSEEIEGAIREENWQNEQWEVYRKNYVKDYLAAARELGYELQLSEDLTILSVRKLTQSEIGRSGSKYNDNED